MASCPRTQPHNHRLDLHDHAVHRLHPHPSNPAQFKMDRSAIAVVLTLLAVSISSASAKLSNNVVDQWVNETQALVAKVGIQNQISARYYGLVGLAAYQALAAGGAPAPALAAFAGHTLLSNWAPWNQGKYDALLAKQLSAAGVSQADAKKASEVAVPIAIKLLKDRTGDESTRYSGFKPAASGTRYAYQYVPNQTFGLYPQLANTTPFLLSSKEAEDIAFNKDPKAGPVFTPPKDDYAETFKLGEKNSKDRKQYDTDSAFFWADGANTSAITGHWLDIAREVLPDLSLEDTALFYARAGLAAYDASIAGWKVKYGVLHWRPETAFNQGYTGFAAQPNWKPLLATPPHPEYLSGHQTTVGAVLEVLLRTLGGKDDVTFSIGSEGAPSLGKRTYTSLTAAATEVGDSRLYGGVHFPSANTDGLKLGRLAAGKVFDRIKPLTTAGSKTAAPVAKLVGAPSTVTEQGKKAAATGRRLRAV